MHNEDFETQTPGRCPEEVADSLTRTQPHIRHFEIGPQSRK